MEGPLQDPLRDRGNELRTQKSSRHRQAQARRLAKVYFAVACKIIACNIKRWAKGACISPKTSLQVSISSAIACVRLCFSCLTGVSLQKEIDHKGNCE